MRAALVYLPLPPPLWTWNFPGSPSGLPGGWRDQNRVHNCTRSPATSPGSAEALPDDAGVVLAFFCAIVAPGEALRPPVFVLYHPMGVGDLRGQEQPMLFLHLCVIGHFLCVWVDRAVGAV